jgi:MoxR-like ATPase
MSTSLAIYDTEENCALRDPFESPAALLKAFSDVGYITNEVTAEIVWDANFLNRPILEEGPAGAGKTELAIALHKITNWEVVRLQCYNGITDAKAVGEYNRSMQELYVLLSKESHQSEEEMRKRILSMDFFLPGPLLRAITSPKRTILLIDEVDKVGDEFEAMLLEVLSVWQISDPGLGTIEAKTIPFTIVTSNAVRILGDPLRRRCLYMIIPAPTPLQQARIVARKSPTLSPKTHLFIAGLAQAFATLTMEKYPSISEMNDLAVIMEARGWDEITPDMQERVLPLIVKREKDLNIMRSKDRFSMIVKRAKEFAAQLSIDDLKMEAANEPAAQRGLTTGDFTAEEQEEGAHVA